MEDKRVPPRRSARPAVPPARLRHAGQPGAAAGLGMAAAAGRGAGQESPATSTEAEPLSPARQGYDHAGALAQIRHFEAECKSGVSTPPASGDEDALNVGGDTASVLSVLDVAGNGGSTSGGDKQGSESDDCGDDADEQSQEETTGEESRTQGKAPGKGRGRPEENTSAAAMKRKRKGSPPLARRKPPKEKRYILWSLAVLRKVCQERGVKGQQRCSDKDVLSKLLERGDQKAGRSSPYTGDFGGHLSPAKGERPRFRVLLYLLYRSVYMYDLRTVSKINNIPVRISSLS